MYKYKPLQEGDIRLLTIERTQPHVAIALQLEHAFLHSKPRYLALSYTWGPAEWGNGSKKAVKLAG
jgi:hypothetical protein